MEWEGIWWFFPRRVKLTSEGIDEKKIGHNRSGEPAPVYHGSCWKEQLFSEAPTRNLQHCTIHGRFNDLYACVSGFNSNYIFMQPSKPHTSKGNDPDASHKQILLCFAGCWLNPRCTFSVTHWLPIDQTGWWHSCMNKRQKRYIKLKILTLVSIMRKFEYFSCTCWNRSSMDFHMRYWKVCK